MKSIDRRLQALEGRGQGNFTRVRTIMVRVGEDEEEVKRRALESDPLLETELLIVIRLVAPGERNAA